MADPLKVEPPILTSNGGKRQYLCPDCRSPNVYKERATCGPIIACRDCHHWSSWRLRISIKATVELT